MAIKVQDTFTEASNTTLSSHVPDVGTAWTRTGTSGTGSEELQVNATSDTVVKQTGATSAGVLYSPTPIPDTADHYAQAQFTVAESSDDTHQLFIRLVDGNNFYVIRFNSSGMSLYKRVGGSTTTLATGLPAISNGSIVRFEAQDSVLRVFINGVCRYTYSDGDLDVVGIPSYGMGQLVVAGDDMDFQEIDNWESGDVDDIYLFQDSFNETTDTDLASHTPEKGTGWTKVLEVGGTINLEASGPEHNMRNANGSLSDGVLYSADVTYPSANYEATAHMQDADSSDDTNILAVRIQDANNMYALLYNTSVFRLYKKVGGSWSALTSDAGSVISAQSKVYLRVEGNTISAGANGVEILSTTDTDITGVGKAGYGMGAVIISGDDMSAQAVQYFTVELLSQTESFTVDGIVKATDTEDFTVDGVVQIVTTDTFTVDGFVALRPTLTFTSDGVVKGTNLLCLGDLLTDYFDGSTSGSLLGNAELFTSNDDREVVRLTEAVNDQWGAVEWEDSLGSNFEVSFSFRATGGNGADATYFYWGCSSTPQSEEQAVGGYLVDYTEYHDQIQLRFNGSVIANVTGETTIDDGNWHEALIRVSGNQILVYFDGVLKIDFTDTTRVLPGNKIGLGARTGGLNQEHLVDYLKICSPFTIDALVAERTEATFTVDGVVENVVQLMITADGAIKDTFTSQFTVDGFVAPPFVLGDAVLPRPYSIERGFIYQKQDVQTLDGKTGRDVGPQKSFWIFRWRYLSRSIADEIMVEVEKNTPLNFRVMDGNLQIPTTSVLAYVPDRGYNVDGEDYLEEFILELTEVEAI